MNTDPNSMTPDDEYAFYANPDHQVPTGTPRRRKSPMGPPVPVRFPDDLLEKIKERADADDRSLSSWIRRAVEHELDRPA